jgi:uncharacterized membrane protein YhaH (DUF805 family)
MTQTPEPYRAATAFPPTNPDVGFGQAISLAFKNYANFEGVAGRREYWWFALFAGLVGLGTAIIDGVAGSAGIIGLLWGLATFLPQLALAVRRLRDAGYHWAFLFLGLIPFVGAIVLIVFLASPSRPQVR